MLIYSSSEGRIISPTSAAVKGNYGGKFGNFSGITAWGDEDSRIALITVTSSRKPASYTKYGDSPLTIRALQMGASRLTACVAVSPLVYRWSGSVSLKASTAVTVVHPEMPCQLSLCLLISPSKRPRSPLSWSPML